MNTRTNTITPATLVPRKYDTVGEIGSEVDAYIESAAPDYKSCIKALDARIQSRTQDPDAHHTEALLDTLYDLGGAFEEMADRAHYKAKRQDMPQYVRHTKRATFYRQIAYWAEASFNLIDGHQSPPTNIDAHSSGPQFDTISNTPLDKLWQQIVSMLDMRYTHAQVARAKIEFDRAVGTVWSVTGTGDDHCRILELFGDACANIDLSAPTEETFWGACVLISDDLRATIAAENIKARSTYAPPPIPPMPIITTASEEFVTAGVMWEVAGDVSRSLCRTKTDAEAWARVLFPSEPVDKRYARIQSRTIIAK